MARLTEVPGVGRWTAEGFLAVALHRDDVVLPGDLGGGRGAFRGRPCGAGGRPVVSRSGGRSGQSAHSTVRRICSIEFVRDRSSATSAATRCWASRVVSARCS
jgi:hypothetical protein